MNNLLKLFGVLCKKFHNIVLLDRLYIFVGKRSVPYNAPSAGIKSSLNPTGEDASPRPQWRLRNLNAPCGACPLRVFDSDQIRVFPLKGNKRNCLAYYYILFL